MDLDPETQGKIIQLLEDYRSLNAPSVDELDSSPSPLEFMRYVALNRPFVVRGGAKDWNASEKWDASYLSEVMSTSPVQVAVTPSGNADATIELDSGQRVMVEPHTRMEPFDNVLHEIMASSRSAEVRSPIKYLQTQNDNLRDEYAKLFADVPKSIDFARIALQQDPDAVNFWLGNQHSTTALHKDNYQNIYAQIRGSKHFVLVPPIGAPAMDERLVGRAKFQQLETEAGESRFEIVLQTDQEEVPVPMWNPMESELPRNIFGTYIEPLHVSVHEGDLLYLPAMYYHHVRQSIGAEGFSISVNYWQVLSHNGVSSR